jgi:hypothetical protein
MSSMEKRYDDLRAMFINCTLKRSPEISNTQGLIDLSRAIMEKNGVQVEVIRAVDHDIATGDIICIRAIIAICLPHVRRPRQ